MIPEHATTKTAPMNCDLNVNVRLVHGIQIQAVGLLKEWLGGKYGAMGFQVLMKNLMDLISCAMCGQFTRDTIGDGSGIGNCASYDAGITQNPSMSEQEKAFKARGGKTFYPDRLRVCKLFVGKV